MEELSANPVTRRLPPTVSRLRDIRASYEESPTIRLSIAGGSRRVAAALSYKQFPAPSILVSFFYIKHFFRFRPRMVFRDWALDSGAFSAANSGKVISLSHYIDACAKMMELDS